MTTRRSPHDESDATPDTLQALLLRLDLATETLEGLDELGVDTREELEALMDQLERQIEEAG